MTFGTGPSTPREKSPKGVHPSGNSKLIQEQILSERINKDRPYQNVTYRGLIIYSAYLSETLFRRKYDETFAEFILKSDDSTGSKDKKRVIIESIVYVPELCGCLPGPQPSEAIEFYKYLKSLTPKDKKEGFESIAKNSKNNQGKWSSSRYLEKIKRYPRAYAVAMGGNNSITDYGINTKVLIRFPYEYDIYAGAIVSLEE